MSLFTNVNWDRLWRMSGINFVIFFIIAYVIYGDQPKVGASADSLVSFYDGDRTRILIATVIFGLGVLNLLWFAAAFSNILRDAGRAGWAAAMTASSAAFGGVFFLLITAGAALSYSIAGAGEPLVLLHRFRGTLDDWDPALVNGLAREYRVVTFDSVGIGGMTNLSSGCRTG